MGMRFVGIDIGADRHVVAAVSEDGTVLLKPTPFSEDAAGYATLRTLLGEPTDTLVALEATGHYWQNVVAVLLARGFAIPLLNPLRTRRFAAEELRRAKTDSIDALAIARFAALWMPTLSAVRRNPWLRRFYERLRARGKLPEVALVAAMPKLLAAVYSVAKHRRPFVPHLTPLEVSR